LERNDGEDREIIAYQREINSGSQTGMLSLVMKDAKIADAPKEKRIEGMAGLVEVISGYDNSASAIGYSYYYYVNSMYVREGIKLIKIDQIEPNPATIQSKQYPYTTAYYVIVRKDEPQDSAARKLLNWALSDDGQKSAKEAGYVPVK
jgi:phosphate transport system substrate-binding protein